MLTSLSATGISCLFFSYWPSESHKKRDPSPSTEPGSPLSPGPLTSNHGLQFSQTWVFKLSFPLAPVVQPLTCSCPHCLCDASLQPLCHGEQPRCLPLTVDILEGDIFYSASIHFNLPVLGTVGSYGEQDHLALSS